MKILFHNNTKTARAIVMIMLLAVLSGCAAKQSQKTCSEVQTNLDYYNSSTFDSKLSRTLACTPQAAKIQLPAPESTRKVPERLDNWLAAVDSSGGEVQVLPDPAYQSEYASKGFDGGFIVGIIFDMVEVAKIAYEKLQNDRTYGPAENYNATLYYIPGSGEITQVSFSKR